MRQKGNAPTSGTRLEQCLGAVVAFAGTSLLVASLVLSSTTVSGCGPCWPGPCADAQPTTSVAPTPTPTPTPTPRGEVDCEIPRSRSILDPNLYQMNSSSCPQVYLSPEGPKYGGGAEMLFCEAGLYMDGADDVFLYRYACDVSEPWKIAPTSIDAEGVTLERSCAGEVPQSDLFQPVETLEAELFEANTSDIVAESRDWRASCVAEDASEERLTLCAEVCAGQTSIYAALEQLDELPETDEVRCYLKLYRIPDDPNGNEVASTDATISMNTSCFCEPTPAFLDCLIGADDPCFEEDQAYDVGCGQDCWQSFGTVSENCPTVE